MTISVWQNHENFDQQGQGDVLILVPTVFLLSIHPQ